MLSNSGDPADFSRAGSNIVRYLGVLQLLTGVAALVGLGFALWPSAVASSGDLAGESRFVALATGAVQVVVALLTILALEPAKRWMADLRAWAAGEAAPPEGHANRGRVLARWIAVGQWVPVALFAAGVPLVWFAAGPVMDAVLRSPELRPQATAGLSPEALRSIGQAATVFVLLTFAVPSLVVNGAILGWVRRWMWGATDASLGLPAREPRMADVAATLARWFRFLQVLLLFFIGLILLTPLQGGTPNASDAQVVAERVTLVLNFFQLALYVALLRWTTVFLAGVTPRVERR